MKGLPDENFNIENLIHQYLEGNISSEEKKMLFRWLGESTENKDYFRQISDIWVSSYVIRSNSDFNTDEGYKRVKARIDTVCSSHTVKANKNIRLNWIHVAAILLAMVMLNSIAYLFLNRNNLQSKDQAYQFDVPYGSKSSLTLPDGTKVILNSGSKLVCETGFGQHHRSLKLVGEGYFIVAKNKELPFIVHTNFLDVKALGTEFNVKAYPEDKLIETVLIKGSVQVLTVKRGDKEPLTLLPRQVLAYNKNSNTIQISIPEEKVNPSQPRNSISSDRITVKYSKTEVNPEILASWKEGAWSIYRKDLSDLAIELERKYDVKIIFKDEKLKKIKFTGTLRNESLEQIINAISLASPIEYKIKGKIVEFEVNEKLMNDYKRDFDTTK